MKIFKSLNIEFTLLFIILIFFIICSHESSLDNSLASIFFNTNEQWIFRNTNILEKVLHKGGVLLTTVILVSLLARFFYLLKSSKDKKQKQYIGFILISSILTILIIFYLKRFSTLPCPWNSTFFGGSISPPRIWQAFMGDLPKAKCFPAGHSSGGFGLLSMYFGHTAIYGKRNFLTLLPGLALGLIFGVTQQMRGAHFLSHDLSTVLVAVVVSWAIALVYLRLEKKYEI